MYLRLFLLIPFLLLFVVSSDAQKTKKDKDLSTGAKARKAASYVAIKAYDKAIPLYSQLNRKQPKKKEWMYQLGVCYLHSGKINKATSLLEFYVKNEKKTARRSLVLYG